MVRTQSEAKRFFVDKVRTPLKREIAGVASDLVCFVQANRPPVGEHLHFSWNDTELPETVFTQYRSSS